MNHKKVLFLIIGFLFSFINVDANCDSVRLKELKEIAEKIEFTYDYTVKNQSNSIIDFNITAVNLNEQIKTLIINDYYMDDYREFKYNSSMQSSLNGFESGERVKITFKAYTTDECSGKTVLTKTISLPYYNSFYNSEECGDYKDFKYCASELLTSFVSSNQFYSELDRFINQNNNISNDDDNENIIDSNINLSEIIGLIIIMISVLVLIILIVIKIKQVRKRRSL